MKIRIQPVTATPCPGTAAVEKGSDAVTTEAAPYHKRPSIGLGQSAYSLGSLNSAKLHYLPHNMCPTPKRTPFGAARKEVDGLNETFA